MDTLFSVLIVVHVLVALSIIGLVLLQHGKGADMGAAFGGGASGSLFGATGSANFLSRTTAVLATVFFATSLALAYIATNKPKASVGVMDAVPAKSVDAKTAPEALKTLNTTPNTTPVAPAPGVGGSKAKDIPN